MATVQSKAEMSFSLTLQITEAEARALQAMTQYGEESFLEQVEGVMSKAEFTRIRDGAALFFKTVRGEIPVHTARFDATRKTFQGQ